MQRVYLFMAATLFTAGLAQAQFTLGKAGPTIQYESALETAEVQPGSTVKGALQVSISAGWHVNGHKTLDPYLISTVLTLEQQPGISPGEVAYPEHKIATFEFSPDPMAVYEGNFILGFLLQVEETVAAGDYDVQGTLRYQACNDKMCAPPQDLAVTIPVKVVESDAPLESAPPEWFASAPWEQLEETPIQVAASEPAEPSPAAPALDETASANTEPVPSQPDQTLLDTPAEPLDGSWRELVEQFEIAGTLAGYTQKQGFLDFLDQSAEGGQPDSAAGGHGWWWMIWVVLAGGLLLNLTPCVLPLIPINVAIIGAGARAGSRVRGFALGGAYGLGIALVYGALGLVVVLGLSTAFGALNSTAWFNAAIAVLFVVLALAMFDIIQIDFSKYQAKLGIQGGGGGHFLAALGMGAVSALLAGACVAPVVIYTILQAQDLYSQGNVFALLLPFGLGVGMALPWPFLGAGLSFLPKPGKWMERVKQAFGIFILAFAAYYGYLAYTLARPQPVQVEEGGVWVSSLETGLTQALEEDRPVIIDFWATWCKNCTVMDRTVLKDEAVLSRLSDYVKIKYQAETLSEPPVKDVVEYFGVMGLPTFIVLEPKG